MNWRIRCVVATAKRLFFFESTKRYVACRERGPFKHVTHYGSLSGFLYFNLTIPIVRALLIHNAGMQWTATWVCTIEAFSSTQSKTLQVITRPCMTYLYIALLHTYYRITYTMYKAFTPTIMIYPWTCVWVGFENILSYHLWNDIIGIESVSLINS